MKQSAGDVLWDNRLIRAILEVAHPILIRTFPQLEAAASKGRFRIEASYDFTPRELYAYRSFRAALILLDTFDRLAEARTYITSFPRQTRYERHNISAYQWLEYHYYYHGILRVALGDRALILVNVVADLDNADRNCTQSVIMENNRVRNTSVGGALKRLIKALDSARAERHASVHHGRREGLDVKYSSEDLELLSVVAAPQLRKGLPQEHRPSQKLLGLLYKQGIAKIVPSLLASEEQLMNATSELFDALLPLYKGQMSVLHVIQKMAESSKASGVDDRAVRK